MSLTKINIVPKGKFLRGMSAFVLAFFMVVTPLAPALAQDAGTTGTGTDQGAGQSNTGTTDTSSTTSDTNTISSTGTSTDTGTSTTDSGSTTSGTTSGATTGGISSPSTPAPLTPSGSGIPITDTAPTNDLKKLTPGVDQNSGALTYSYPIAVPPGRNGMTPDVSLNYNSQNTANDSIVGYGWSTSIPYIVRVNKSGTGSLYTSTDFTSSLSGELTLISGTTYAPKSDDLSLSYDYDGTKWTVKDKKGTTYIFGLTSGAREYDPSTPTDVYKWMLEKTIDTNGNYISYSYFTDNNKIYPQTITYTHNGSSFAPFEVDFQYIARPDMTESYGEGFLVKTTKIMSEIDVLSDGVWIKKYVLADTTGDNGTRALLSSITESGKDSLGTITTLPAEQFAYQHSTASWTTDTTTWSPLPWGADTDMTALQDLNGDGYPDLISSYQHFPSMPPPSLQVTYTQMGVGTAWTYDASLIPPIFFRDWYMRPSGGGGFNSEWGLGTELMDVNGDQYPDIIQSLTGTSGAMSDAWLNNLGTGWTHVPAWAPTLAFDSTDNIGNYGTSVSDMNGDGLPDLLYFNYPSKLEFDTGTGFGPVITTTLPTTPEPMVFPTMQLVDVNGDGLADLVYSEQHPVGVSALTTEQTFINNGNNTWTHDTAWDSPILFAASGIDQGVRLFDINGDGLPDIVQSGTSGYNVYLNTGDGWTSSSTYTASIAGFRTFDATSAQPLDINADGLMDIAAINLPTGLSTEVRVHNGLVPDLLSNITLPTGGTTTVTYKASTHYLTTSGTPESPNLPLVLPTVATVTKIDPLMLSSSGIDTYSYLGGTYFYNSASDRKFAGFHEVDKTDSLGNVTKTYYHTGNGTDVTRGEFADDEAKIGKVYREEQYDNSGNLYQVTVNKWDEYVPSAGHTFVKLVRSTNMTFDGTTSHRDTSQEFMYDNTNGNILQKTNWGEVTAANDGSFTDIGTDKSTENISYAVPTSGSVVGLPSDEALLDQSGATVSETRDYYDSLALGSVSLGNQTQEKKLISGSTYAITQKTYDGTYGLVVTSTDPDSNTTTYAYDSYNLYPATVADALSHTTGYLYDYANGKPTQTTDVNGFVYKTSFDGLDRPTAEYVPDFGGMYAPVLKTTYGYVDTSLSVSVHQTDYLDGSTMVDTYTYKDGFGRDIQARKSSAISGTFNVIDTAYNSIGLKAQSSLPYASSGTSRTSPSTMPALYTTYTYDPMERITISTNALGATTSHDSLWTTTVTDPMSKVHVYYKDARNNLVQVDEHNGSSVYSTYYSWNLNGKLIGMTDALGNVRNFTYDDFGNRLTAEDLHAPSATTYGVWNYTYDPAGNMTQSVSPNGNTVNHTFDALNRELTENWTGGTGTEITYAYDTCTNGVGKLCTVTMLSGADTAYTYDSNGNISQDTKSTNPAGGPFVTAYTYNRQKGLVTIAYPDGAGVLYTYGTDGQIARIQHNESGGAYSDIISSMTYSPTGEPISIIYANGVVTTNTYDPAHLYRLTAKTSINGSSVHLQDLAYTYDADSDITNIVDSSATDSAKTAAYTYDDLNRLLSATITGVPTGTSPYTYSYTYDAVGNILTGPAGTYLYAGTGGVNPHAATSIAGGALTYDNDGNELTDSTVTDAYNYIWNYKDQPKEIDYNSSGTETLRYDYDGTRVAASQPSNNYDYYPNKYYEYDAAPGDDYEYIYAGDMLAATVKIPSGGSAVSHYVQTDHISGTGVVTDTSGAQEQLLDYYPFGGVRLDEQATSFNEERQFGGHWADNGGVGINYFGARYYDPSFGRFVSEDPTFLSIGDEGTLKSIGTSLNQVLADPQSSNSYSYARENPIIHVDPNGKCIEDLCIGEITFAASVISAYAPQISSFVQETASDIADTVTMAASNPAIQNAVIRGVTGAGVNITSQVLGDEAAGQKTSTGSLAVNGVTGFLSGVAGSVNNGLGFNLGLSMGGNALSQLYNNGWNFSKIDKTSLLISAGATTLTSGIISNVPSGVSQLGKTAVETAIDWTAETAGQVINSGLKTSK